jgi:hypothetical protein
MRNIFLLSTFLLNNSVGQYCLFPPCFPWSNCLEFRKTGMHKKYYKIQTAPVRLYVPMVSKYNTICVYFHCLITLQHFCWYYVLVILLPTAAARKFGKNQSPGFQTCIARSISVKDVIAVLEREPQMSKSSLLYRLYERTHSDTST